MEQIYASKLGKRVIAGICLVLAYIFASLAIDSGRWLHYFLTIVALGIALNLLVSSFKTHGKK